MNFIRLKPEYALDADITIGGVYNWTGLHYQSRSVTELGKAIQPVIASQLLQHKLGDIGA